MLVWFEPDFKSRLNQISKVIIHGEDEPPSPLIAPCEVKIEKSAFKIDKNDNFDEFAYKFQTYLTGKDVPEQNDEFKELLRNQIKEILIDQKGNQEMLSKILPTNESQEPAPIKTISTEEPS